MKQRVLQLDINLDKYQTHCLHQKTKDKREEKTITSIYLAFTKLINNKDYNDITVQDILDESKVGRSTFYSHFNTKDELLLKVSQDIFMHVFSPSLKEESSHDFSSDKEFDYKHLITHILYHLLDERDLIKGILSSHGNNIFLSEFKNNLYIFINTYFSYYPYQENNIPLNLKKEMIVEGIITIVKYWVNNNYLEKPEVLTEYITTTLMK